MKIFWKNFSKLCDAVLDLVFETRCLGCGLKGNVFCGTCIKSMPPSAANNLSKSDIHALFDYQHKIVKDAIWRLKYSGTKEIAGIFAHLLYDKFFEDLSERFVFENFHDPLLVPIPLSAKRQRERGFNQAELIAKELAMLAGEKNFFFEPSALLKTRDTPSQASIKNRDERLKNLNGCFSVRNKTAVLGRTIILVDDVSTTGATIQEARRALHKAGAKKVIAFVVAH